MFLQKPPGKVKWASYTLNLSLEQKQKPGSLAPSVTLRFPTALCSWLPEPVSSEFGRQESQVCRLTPTAASRAQAGGRVCQGPSPWWVPHRGALVQVSVLAE